MLDLQRAQWGQLGGLLFVARRLVEGMWAGRHASTRFGAGTEFHDYRAYAPGDDLAEVDWKLYGRTDRYFVRRHQQFTDLQTHLLVDCSASMNFAGLDGRGRALLDPGSRAGAVPRRERGPAIPVPKLRYAAMLAAAIAFLTIRQSDRAGLGLFAERLLAHLPAGGTWAHLQRLCAELERAQPVVKPGDLGASLRQAHALLSGRGAAGRGNISGGRGGGARRNLLVLISDLLDEPGPLFDGLARFRHGAPGSTGGASASGGGGGGTIPGRSRGLAGEVIVFQILTPQELDLAGLARLRLQLVDAETRRQVATDVRRVQGRYRELVTQHLTAIAGGCAARGIDYNLLTTDQPVVAALRRYLVKRSALAR